MEYPRFIKGKENGTALRLLEKHQNKAEYYRDGGHYSLSVYKEGERIYCHHPLTGKKTEMEECTYSYWKSDNGDYAPEKIKEQRETM